MPDWIFSNTPIDKLVQIREAIEKNGRKAVLLSIKKEWLDKIASGEKTIELRKTMPTAIKFPFAVLCYETMTNGGSGKVCGTCLNKAVSAVRCAAPMAPMGAAWKKDIEEGVKRRKK